MVQKNVWPAPSLKNDTSYDCHLLYTRKMILSPGIFVVVVVVVFFLFFKIFVFRIFSGVKEQKIVQNDKKLCPWYSISQEPCMI